MRKLTRIPGSPTRLVSMRFLRHLALAIAFGILCPSVLKAETNSNQQKPDAISNSDIGEEFKKAWPVNTVRLSTGTRCQVGETANGLTACVYDIKRLLEPANLTADAEVSVDFNNGQSALPKYAITKQSATLEDRFYIEQAIWEVAPFRLMTSNAKGECILGKNSRGCSQYHSKELFFKAHPTLSSRSVVVIHVIPCSIAWRDRGPTAFTVAELNGLHNLKAIPTKYIQSDMLQSFRSDWCAFVAKHQYHDLTRTEVLDFAGSMLSKYRPLFES